MPKLLISKFIDEKKTFENNLATFENIPMQIGFYGPKSFFKYDHSDLVKRCEDNNIKIHSIHAPTIDIFEEKAFFKMLELIKDKYGIDNITIHPSSGNPLTAFKLLDKYAEKIKELNIYLLYENFDSSKNNKRWLPYAKNIFKMPNENIFLTYDTSHVKIGTNIVEEISDYLHKVGMIHLSNKKKGQNHVPIFEGEHNLKPVIEYLKNYPSYVTLEYHDNDSKLIEDYNYLYNFFKA